MGRVWPSKSLRPIWRWYRPLSSDLYRQLHSSSLENMFDAWHALVIHISGRQIYREHWVKCLYVLNSFNVFFYPQSSQTCFSIHKVTKLSTLRLPKARFGTNTDDAAVPHGWHIARVHQIHVQFPAVIVRRGVKDVVGILLSDVKGDQRDGITILRAAKESGGRWWFVGTSKQ